ncbi:MmcQ/YjbR family DNA-binding protein [Schaalia sp. 19OD2882]|uniref:MmcQ/YjbR family DNA-binding protein n=1 Tax=Schaalia sp. 19OD2882 TaxID=2794089 RepID=UPI001C1F0E73|nr:MmcQ/YjbR family DNA-binding protein [Schaalia sp. 19OD2882]QWW19966.1 MmcQ/YjbR family DNA-binding protein [Schaalia sp. 19OD2882]
MDARTLVELVESSAEELQWATVDQPFGPGWAAWRVSGKIFVVLGSLRGRRLVNLKCAPEDARALVAACPDITEGYHMNKKHWITLWAEDRDADAGATVGPESSTSGDEGMATDSQVPEDDEDSIALEPDLVCDLVKNSWVLVARTLPAARRPMIDAVVFSDGLGPDGVPPATGSAHALVAGSSDNSVNVTGP